MKPTALYMLNQRTQITHQSTLAENQASGKGYQRESNLLSRKALLYVKGEGNGLKLAAHDIEIKGADIVNEGKGHTQLQAENSLKLTALETSFSEKMGGGDHYRQSKSQDVIISRIKGKGDVMIEGKDILSEGGQLESEKKLTALAENSLVLKGAQTVHHFEEYHHSKTGSLAKKSKTSFESRDRHSAYPYNELYVESPDGKTKYRLDSYDPDKKEIVSRKETQFAEIQLSTGIGYLNEIPKKYSRGSIIADVPSSGVLSGKTLQGLYILEVPVQSKPIPQNIINKANELKIIIRDINGKEYN